MKEYGTPFQHGNGRICAPDPAENRTTGQSNGRWEKEILIIINNDPS